MDLAALLNGSEDEQQAEEEDEPTREDTGSEAEHDSDGQSGE